MTFFEENILKPSNLWMLAWLALSRLPPRCAFSKAHLDIIMIFLEISRHGLSLPHLFLYLSCCRNLCQYRSINLPTFTDVMTLQCRTVPIHAVLAPKIRKPKWIIMEGHIEVVLSLLSAKAESDMSDNYFWTLLI